MKITEAIKEEIKREYDEFREKLYAGKSIEERKELDQFFTPPELTIQMIERMGYDSLSGKSILDPTCGSGNLLVACLIAGAEPENLYGNDYDGAMVELCRTRITAVAKALGYADEDIPVDINIHRGNAMQKMCLTDFSVDYNNNYNEEFIDILEYAQEDYRDPRTLNTDELKQIWKEHNIATAKRWREVYAPKTRKE